MRKKTISMTGLDKIRMDKLKYMILLLLSAPLAAVTCGGRGVGLSAAEVAKSVVVMYDNDVHCEFDGYRHFAALRDAIAAPDTADVLTVSSGDYLQGGPYGAVSSGGYVVDMMNAVGYDVVGLGNHEFDYGIPRLQELMRRLEAPVTCVNLTAAGSSQPLYASYVIKKAGGRRIAFIGVVTPETMYSEGHAFKDAEGRRCYDLHPGDLADCVQRAVDAARKDNADHVILLSHLGEEEGYNYKDGYSLPLIASTTGIDVVLDAHSHHQKNEWHTNAEGKMVLMLNTGSRFESYGKLWIGRDGTLGAVNISASEVAYSSEKVCRQLERIERDNERLMSEPLCTSRFCLTIDGEDGQRLVRNGETNLADLVCDAYASVAGTRIALCNGGGIRTSIAAGQITYRDVLAVSPFENELCIIRATGQQLMDALEMASRLCPAETGAFMQCAGIRYTIDTRIRNTLAVNEDNVLCVQGARRVRDVEVLQDDGTYKPIDPAAMYDVAVSEYVAFTGDEIRVLRPCQLLVRGIVTDTEALCRFFKERLAADGVPDRYCCPQGRITVIR